MTPEEYHARPEWSASQLVRVYAASVHAALQPFAPTPAMRAGTLIHDLLEGKQIDAVDPTAHPSTVEELRAALADVGIEMKKSARKADLEDAAVSSGIVPRSALPADAVTTDELAHAQLAVDAIDAKIASLGLSHIRTGQPEVSLFGEAHGLPVRCRPDVLFEDIDGSITIVSWKTCAGGLSAPARWSRVYRYQRHYDLADALYIDIVRQSYPGRSVGLIGVTVDRDDPCEETVLVWTPSIETLERGAAKLREAITAVHRYRTTHRAGLPDHIVEV